MARKNILVSIVALLGLILVGGGVGYWFFDSGKLPIPKRLKTAISSFIQTTDKTPATPPVSSNSIASQESLASLPTTQEKAVATPPSEIVSENTPVPQVLEQPHSNDTTIQEPLADDALQNSPVLPIDKEEQNAAAQPSSEIIDSTQLEDNVKTEVESIPEISIAEPLPDKKGIVSGKASTKSIDKEKRPQFAKNELDGKAFVKDLAKLLVENYWPEGTHVHANGSGFVSLTPRIMNVRYGVGFTGFADNGNNLTRNNILAYVFTPSMLGEWHANYTPLLLEQMNYYVGNLKRGKNAKLLQSFEQAEMYYLYADLFQSLGELCGAYAVTSEIQQLFANFRQAEFAAQKAGAVFFDAQNAGVESEELLQLASKYQISIVQRELARDAIVSAMRRKADIKNFEADDILFLTAWLQRRGEDAIPSIIAMEVILKDFSAKLRQQAVNML